MKTELIKSILVIATGLMTIFLFSSEIMGINTLIFTSIIIGITYFLDPESFQNPRLQLVIGGTFILSILVVWHNSILSKTIFIASFILMIGIIQQRTLRFLWYGFLLGIGSLLSAPINFFQKMSTYTKGGGKNFIKWGQIIVLPMAIVFVFFMIYYVAVPSFGNISDRFTNWLGQFFEWKFPGPAFWLFVLGSFICVAIVWENNLGHFLLRRDQQFRINLRRRKKKQWYPYSFSFLGLKKEYLMAMICISILNGLLLIVNFSHLTTLLFHSNGLQAKHLSKSLHASTELLIFSIIMAMGLLLFFFRRNLNFYPNNQLLKVLAYTWLGQNGILALLTFFQDIQYILNYGMAYYRLWLAFFLFMVIIGLISIYFKIAKKRSIYYLLVVNALNLYLCLILISSFNWDLIMTRFNIFHAKNEQLDLHFLFHNVSDKNTYILLEHKEFILSKKQPHYSISEQTYDDKMKIRRLQMGNRWSKQSWKSWNLAKQKNKKALDW